ncbi:biopolymer transporter ExbD [Planctomycetales bacterium ZRK34]|nr:biopolymer transporter ExbD [Planctomycetales bacterium ZRK34]
MGRFHNSSSGEGEETTIDISPLIDCVFILLIFFIVTTTFVEESGMKVDKPQAAQAVAVEESKTLTFYLTANGQVLCEGQKIGLSGIQTLVKAKLRTDDDAPVVIQADATAHTAMLTRVIDEARLAGAKTVNIAAKQTKG